jgi:hypothetical protein
MHQQHLQQQPVNTLNTVTAAAALSSIIRSVACNSALKRHMGDFTEPLSDSINTCNAVYDGMYSYYCTIRLGCRLDLLVAGQVAVLPAHC